MTASKRIACLVMCVLCFMTASFTASAEETTALTSGEFSYEILDDETICVTAYTGSGGEVTVPQEIDGKTVTALGDELFWYMEEVTAISLPETLEYIGARVFQNCTSITEIKLPDSVTQIDDACFLGCSSLSKINVPSSLVYVGAFAFDETPWITQFDGCSSIILGGRVFYKYLADEDMVVIPKDILCISDNAFDGKALSFVKIPDSVAFIGDYCFYNCPNLKEIKLPASVYYLGENSLGLISGPSQIESVEGFVIYADESTLGADYAKKYEVTLKASAQFSEPQVLPEAEECVPTAEIRTADTSAPSPGLSHGSVVAIVLSIGGCVIVIGGITVASYFYEKNRKKQLKENQNSKKKKK